MFDPIESGSPAAAIAWIDGDPPEGWLEVDERVQWDRGGSHVHRIIFFRRRSTLTREEFAAHWTNRHAPLAARHHPTMVRYVQNVVLSPGDVDGVAELGFASLDDLTHHVYDSPQGRLVIRDDVARFIDPHGGQRVDGRPRVVWER